MAVELVTNGALIRSAHMANYYWKELAKRLVSSHAAPIAAAILREQADRSEATWFAEYSEAKGVLAQCVAADPAGVWRALVPHLSSHEGFSFSVGFPRGLLDQLPVHEVLGWVAEKPNDRASIAARLMSKNLSSDDTLASLLLGAYGDNEEIGGAVFSAYITGSWSGPASAHWLDLANQFEAIAKRTDLPKLREWALQTIARLRQMAEHDAQREEEKGLRR